VRESAHECSPAESGAWQECTTCMKNNGDEIGQVIVFIQVCKEDKCRREKDVLEGYNRSGDRSTRQRPASVPGSTSKTQGEKRLLSGTATATSLSKQLVQNQTFMHRREQYTLLAVVLYPAGKARLRLNASLYTSTSA
jgi:hypothetical protein